MTPAESLAQIKDLLCPGVSLTPAEIAEAVRSMQAENERLRQAAASRSLVEIQQEHVKRQLK